KVWADLERALADDPDDEKQDPSARRQKAAQQVAAQTERDLQVARDGWMRYADVLQRADAEAELLAAPKGRPRKGEGHRGDGDGDQPGSAASGPWLDETDATLVRTAALAVVVGLILLMVDRRVGVRRWRRTRGGGRVGFAVLVGLGLSLAGAA